LNIKKLFIVDGVGALLSAFFLGVVLVKLQALIGMPKNTLYVLAVFPVFFALYDFISYFQKPITQVFLLKLIAYFNSIYCIVSMYLLFQHAESLLPLGWLYFIGEIIILGILIFIELRTVRSYKLNH